MLRRGQELFAGQRCIRAENESLVLWATIDVGPRILGLALQGQENLFAALPHLTLDCPGSGDFHLHGGHRLWIAPEDPPMTYLPDDLPIDVEDLDGGFILTQPVEPRTGIQKQLILQFPGPGAEVTLDHVLINRGSEEIQLAPWAITQFKVTGEAFLPLSAGVHNPSGVLPDRQITLWPYTDLDKPQLRMGKNLIRLHASMQDGAFKIGFPNPSGWLAYRLDRALFVKTVEYQQDAKYLDLGSSSECYCNDLFLELETLGPYVNLQPGESTLHREAWKLYSNIDIPDDEEGAIDALRPLGLIIAGEDP